MWVKLEATKSTAPGFYAMLAQQMDPEQTVRLDTGSFQIAASNAKPCVSLRIDSGNDSTIQQFSLVHRAEGVAEIRSILKTAMTSAESDTTKGSAFEALRDFEELERQNS